ncbi:MAG TPA: GTPase HflX [Flavobacteriales bacterium]|nr:GTPase HflX [Flavobacteriales bacterium]
MSEEKKINKNIPQTAVLVGVINSRQGEERVKEYLDELEFLATTAGITTKKRFTQKLEVQVAATHIGTGKLQEIADYIKENSITVLIFDDELSPSQQRNIEKMVEIPVLDRTSLILEIFATRARTSHAKTQVELARYQYILPRLTRMWTHLERQRGGTGTRSGSGELQIESDRRVVLEKIAKLKEDLKMIDKQMAQQRGNRGQLVRVSLVGYTNVGKSTLMNVLSKSEVFAENKLFATLDTTVRKVVFENLPFLLTDTVGFIRKLPTQLIESFKSTLDEVREADLLIHVVDISHPNFEDHINVVNQTLKDIGAGDKEMIMVFNKIDAYTFTEKDEDDLTPATKDNLSLADLKKTWMADHKGQKAIFISAQNRTNLAELRELVYEDVKRIFQVRYPYNNFLY